MKPAGRLILWLLIALTFLKQADLRADLAFIVQRGGSTSHEDAGPNEGVPEDRFDFGANGAKWRFRVNTVNLSRPRPVRRYDDQYEKAHRGLGYPPCVWRRAAHSDQ